MARFEKYTLLELSDPSLAHQIVTEFTEDLFCGFAVEPIFVTMIQDNRKSAEGFDSDVYEWISSLPAECKGDDIAPLNLWEALEEDSISRGIATAISTYVRSLAAHKVAVAADAEVGYLMSFKEDAVDGDGPGARTTATQSAPKFKLDFATAQALVDRKAYEGLDLAAYTRILEHDGYRTYVTYKLQCVLYAYSYRIWAAIEQATSLWVYRKILDWVHVISGVPPHLIRFTPYKPSTIWSVFKSKQDQLRPGYVRMHWNCSGNERHLDIPERIVQATKAALATAPKVPYLASEWVSGVPLFIPKDQQRRWAKGAAIPEYILERWADVRARDLAQSDLDSEV